MTKISIITPTYNRANVLSDTIDSVLQQTIDDFEYFVVDDGSTDNTEQVVTEYDDKRISYLQLSGNQGANVARNRGIKAATGQYITFLDSDDKYLPRRLEVTVSTLDGLSKKICGVTHAFESTISDEVVRRYSVKNGRITIDDLRSSNAIGGFSDVMFRSEIFDRVGLLDEEMPSYQDYEFYLRAVQEGDVHGIDKVLCRKQKQSRNHSFERISNNVEKKIRGQELLLDKHGDKLSQKARASFYYNRGRLYMTDGAVADAKRAFRSALSLYPYHPLYYYNYVASLGGKQVFDNAQLLKRKVSMVLSKLSNI